MGKATKLYNKTKRGGLASAIIGGLVTVGGIVLLVLPLAGTADVEEITKNVLSLLLGGVLLISGFCIMISGLTGWLVRPYAVVFTDTGMYDFTGKHKNGMFIEWNNIKDAHVYGKGDSSFIGIELISLEIADKYITKKDKREIYENISAHMPAVIIRQSEVNEPIGGIVKAILQIRLGAKADMFEQNREESAAEEEKAPEFSKDELDELRLTGNVSFAPEATDKEPVYKEDKWKEFDLFKAEKAASEDVKSDSKDIADDFPVSQSDIDTESTDSIIQEENAVIAPVASSAKTASRTPKGFIPSVFSEKADKEAVSAEGQSTVEAEAESAVEAEEKAHKAAKKTEKSDGTSKSIDELLSMLSIGDDN